MSAPSNSRILPLLFILAIACQPAGGSDSSNAQSADEAASAVSAESALLTVVGDGIEEGASLEDATVAAMANAESFSPSGCAVATTESALGRTTVTYVMDDCTGPFGLVHVTGTLVTELRVMLASGALQMVATTEGLQINGATLNIEATAMRTTSGGTEVYSVTSSTDGIGERGGRFSRSGSFDVRYTPATMCLALDASVQTTILGVTWTASVAGLERCADMCPSSGTLTWMGPSNTLSLTYDGTSTAMWRNEARETSGSVMLFCE